MFGKMFDASAPISNCWVRTHCILMALGWLVFIPAGLWNSVIGRRSHPNGWLCRHAIFMVLAGICIFPATVIAYWYIPGHFSVLHQVLSPVLTGILLNQALVGLILGYCNWTNRPQWNLPLRGAHRITGMLLYLGGLCNELLSFNVYQRTLDPQPRMLAALGAGMILALQATVLSAVVPVWWRHIFGSNHDQLLPQEEED